MIRKLLLSMLAVVSTFFTASADDITLNWAHVLCSGTSAGQAVIGTCKSADGLYYIATTWGTNSGKSIMTLKLDGETVKGLDGEAIEGSPYTGTSINDNLMLQKLDPTDGTAKWFAYTKKGSMPLSSYCHVLPTSDDGVIAILKTRAWVADAGLDNLLEIVDGTGATTTIKDMNTQRSEYRYLIVRFNKDGKLLWSRLFCGQYHAEGEGTYTNNAVDNCHVYGATLDDDENIYLAGKYCTKLYFKKSDGTTATFTAHSDSTWNGSSQDVSDLFLVKLDKNGYYTNSLFQTGSAKLAVLDKIVYNDGTLYVDGRIKGDSTAISLGGKALTVDSLLQTTLIASINAEDLSVNYAKTLTSVTGIRENTGSTGFANLNKNIQYINGSLYLTGGLFGNWQQDGVNLFPASTTANTGYLLKVDPATGKVISGTLASKAYNLFGVFEKNNNLYAFGDGILFVYDPSTLANTASHTLCSNFGVTADCNTPLVDGDNVLFANRGKGTPKYYNATNYATVTTETWAIAYYSYKFPTVETSINNATNEAKVANYDVYSLDGMLIKKATTLSEAKSGLAKGVYIIGGEKLIVE